MAMGWLKLHRKVLDSAVADSMELLGCWVWILTHANWEERQLLDGTVLQPGELVTGMERLAAAWKCSKSTAHSRTQKFKKLGMVELKPRTAGTVITVCNWSVYQSEGDENRTQTERKSNASRTIDRTLAERGAEPEREERSKEVKKKEKEGLILPSILNSPEFHTILKSWQDYRGSSYKPRGFSSLIAQAENRANMYGLAAVVNAFEVAMGNGWKGWNQDSIFNKSIRRNGNGDNHIGPGQRFDANNPSDEKPRVGF